MTFVDQLEIFKIAPLSGPIGGNTHVKIYGNGMLSSLPKENPVFVKFGTIESQQVDKNLVSNIEFHEEEYLNELKIDKHLLDEAEKHDPEVAEG